MKPSVCFAVARRTQLSTQQRVQINLASLVATKKKKEKGEEEEVEEAAS